jgi:hypothetical protein
MSSTQDLVLGATARKMHKRKDKRQRKKRMGRIGKKRLHIFLDESKLAFNRWEEVPKSWTFETCEAYIEWCHIVEVLHITATRSNARRIRPTCIFASGLFSKNGA